MIINLSPQRRDDGITASVSGDVLTVNGVPYDFGPLVEGATLTADAVDCDFIVGTVTRTAGEVVVTMILPHKEGPSHGVAFPVKLAAEGGPLLFPFDANNGEYAGIKVEASE